MSHSTSAAAVSTALAISLLGASSVSAEPSLRGDTAAHHSRISWSDIRVSVSRDGSVTSEKIMYASGNTAFNTSALQAVAATTFVPDAHHAGPSTFDYAVTEIDGKRSSRILGPMRGDPSVSAFARVRVLVSGDAWLVKPRACLVAVR